MIQNSVINRTIKKYIKLKGFDVEFNKLKNDLVTYCVDYIKSHVPQEILDLASAGNKVIVYQSDVNIYRWDAKGIIKGLAETEYSTASEYFGIDTLEFKKYSLPHFFSVSDLSKLRDKEKSEEFVKNYSDFVETFKEKYLALIKYAAEAGRKANRIKVVLSNSTATLTLIKENYRELYNLIKS